MSLPTVPIYTTHSFIYSTDIYKVLVYYLMYHYFLFIAFILICDYISYSIPAFPPAPQTP